MVKSANNKLSFQMRAAVECSNNIFI